MNSERQLWTATYLAGFAGYVILAGHDIPAYDHGLFSPIYLLTFRLLPAFVAFQAAESRYAEGALSRTAAVVCLMGVALWDQWRLAAFHVLPLLAVATILVLVATFVRRGWSAGGHSKQSCLILSIIWAVAVALWYPYLARAMWVPLDSVMTDGPASVVAVLLLATGVLVLLIRGCWPRAASGSTPPEPFSVWERIVYRSLPFVLCILSFAIGPVLTNACSVTDPSILRRTVSLTRLGTVAAFVIAMVVRMRCRGWSGRVPRNGTPD